MNVPSLTCCSKKPFTWLYCANAIGAISSVFMIFSNLVVVTILCHELPGDPANDSRVSIPASFASAMPSIACSGVIRFDIIGLCRDRQTQDPHTPCLTLHFQLFKLAQALFLRKSFTTAMVIFFCQERCDEAYPDLKPQIIRTSCHHVAIKPRENRFNVRGRSGALLQYL